MNEEEKIIETQFNTLPPKLQRGIKVIPWKIYVSKIGEENNLNHDQIASLEQETMFILYAFESPSDYISNIKNNVGIIEDMAINIAGNVAERIFAPVENEVERESGGSEQVNAPSVPEIAPTNLPMIETNEVAHDVPHVEQVVTKTELPDYRYPENKDPYREQPQ